MLPASATPSPPRPPPTYTTIPIAGADVISRSLHNLTSSFSFFRPLPEFFAVAELSPPPSLSSAKRRLFNNLSHFRLNYAVLTFSCVLVSLLFFESPFSLLFISAIFLLWLVLYFFREDPLLLWGRHVTDTFVLAALVAVSVLAVWSTGSLGTLAGGLAIGGLIVAVHGFLRNDEGLFLNEQEAVSRGLIAPGQNGNTWNTN
ncbi:PRA1 family protein G2 [Aristolochia californica]|uniref:PRA1 family protein G2 n=1 Tax=Aristolochia californica TaxID=171875 RepID=UPI0035E2A3E9